MKIEKGQNGPHRTLSIEAGSHVEMLASIPITAGYKIENSLAAVMFEVLPEHEGGGINPETGQPRLRSSAVGTCDHGAPEGFLANMVLKTMGAMGAILVSYDDEPLDDPDTNHRMRTEAKAIIEGGRAVLGAFHVTSEGWYSYVDQKGGPASDLVNVVLDHHEDIAEHVPTTDMRGDYEPIVEPKRNIVGALASETMKMIGRAVSENVFNKAIEAYDKDDILDLYERLLTEGPDQMSDDELARVLISWELPEYRDLCLMQWGSDRETAARIYESHFDPSQEALPEHGISIGRWIRPPEHRLNAGVLAGRRLAGLAHGSTWLIVPMYLGAWCSWANGNSQKAGAMLEIVREAWDSIPEDNKNTLDQLSIIPRFAMAVFHGIMPEWVFDKEL